MFFKKAAPRTTSSCSDTRLASAGDNAAKDDWQTVVLS